MTPPDAASNPQHDEQGSQWVLFSLGGEEYAVLAMRVQEIVRSASVTPVPNLPQFVKGICNLGGKIAPIMDLKERFGIKGDCDPARVRIIVSHMDNQLIGFLVDSVSVVKRIPESDIDKVPISFPKVDVEYIYGIAKVQDRLILLLNLERIISNMEKLIMESAKWDKK